MNQAVRPPKVPKKPPRKVRDHTEFLPAALEILETPASPGGGADLIHKT